MTSAFKAKHELSGLNADDAYEAYRQIPSSQKDRAWRRTIIENLTRKIFYFNSIADGSTKGRSEIQSEESSFTIIRMGLKTKSAKN